jgi:glycerophosphoryl diester phosphodiesterase
MSPIGATPFRFEMRIPLWVEKLFHLTSNALFAAWPQPIPDMEKLLDCRIVSHRGEHDNASVFENTIEAFDTAHAGGVWGVEFDIRWTRDLHPVVSHDRDLQRIFGSARVIGRMTRAELRKTFPLIPFLEEVIDRYGRHMHLMVEIKEEAYPDPEFQSRRLSQIFSGLTPEMDYHFLSLAPAMFRHLDFVPASSFIAVSQLNVTTMSRQALERHYQGLAGHYLFMTRHVIRLHKQNRQQIGTGYIHSRNSLFRELNRDVDWIFSNHAVHLQQVLQKAINAAPAR